VKFSRSAFTPPNFSEKALRKYPLDNLPSVAACLLDFIPEAVTIGVGASIFKFMDSFQREAAKVSEANLKEFAKASKNRLVLFRQRVTEILVLISDRVELEIVNSRGEAYDEGFTPLSNRCYLQYLNEDMEDDFTKLITQCHPRSYRHLYDGLVILLRSLPDLELSTNDQVSLIEGFLVLAHSVGQIYELLDLPLEEVISEESEWLDTITSDSPTVNEELNTVLSSVLLDIKSRKPPPYVADLAAFVKRFNSLVKTRKWNVEDDASHAMTSSACRDKRGLKNVPNKHVFMCHVEQDPWLFPGDELIGYYSNYPLDNLPFKEVKVRGRLIEKTTRGLRPIWTPAGPIRDRANYFLRIAQELFRSMTVDCTFNQSKGDKFVEETTKDGRYWSISLDLKSATDKVSHHFIRLLWSELFGSDISDYLFNLCTGEAIVTLHTSNGKETELTVKQSRGVMQGVPGVFELALSFSHHILIRCVMYQMHLQNLKPEEMYRLLGDDSFVRLRSKGHVFIETYTRLMTSAGFEVHRPERGGKGIVTPPNQSSSLGEFSKKVRHNGSIISPIPFKLFFKPLGLDSDLSRLNWLSQYECFTHVLPDMVENYLWRNQNVANLRTVLGVLCKHQVLGLRLPCQEVPEEMELRIITEFVRTALTHSCVEHLVNPKGRLDLDECEQQLSFYRTVNGSALIEQLVDHAHDCGVELPLLELIGYRNAELIRHVKGLLAGTSLDSYAWIVPFTDEERDLFCKTMDLLESGPDGMDSTDYIQQILRGKKFISSIRQHDVVGLESHTGRIVAKLCSKLAQAVERPS